MKEIRLERTTDRKLIESVALHPEIAHEVANDAKAGIVFGEHIYWLAAYTGTVLVGFVMFLPIYGIAYNPHIAILPEHRGCGTEVMRRGVAWMFAHTRALKILAFPFKPAMIRIYEKCGFHIEGLSNSLVWHKGEFKNCLIVAKEKHAPVH